LSEARDVHPVADLFPMLGPDELADLAADIAERGLLHPIVLDVEGRILDGRNRLAACEKAEVVPEFVTYEGDDPDGYVLAEGILRRELKASQRYIVLEQHRRLRGLTKMLIATNRTDVSRLSQAAVVLDWAPNLAAEIMAGSGMTLDTAAKEARKLKSNAAEVRAKKDRLRSGAADLADLVDAETLDLDEALAALDAREEKARQDAESLRLAEEARQSAADAEKARQDAEYRDELDRRAARLAKLAVGWGEIPGLADEKPYAADLLALLTDRDRATVLDVIDIYRKATQ
jgi:hypothetical protein